MAYLSISHPGWLSVKQMLSRFCDACTRITSLFGLRKSLRTFYNARHARPQPDTPEPVFRPAPQAGKKFQRKPDRVRQKVIRLCAINPHASLRNIQEQFNRSKAALSGETVSHTYVSRVRKAHAYEIGLLARGNHNRRPKPVPRHLVWAADLTFLPNDRGTAQPILGILEHASRACLTLKALPNKTSVTLLRALADVIERLDQKPKFLRTDNEPVFTSRVFRFGLWLAGIRHQTTDVASPWQNGKMERFFGLFKSKIGGLAFQAADELNQHLATFRFWYNHIRPHGYLDGLTPFEAYHKQGITYAQPGQEEPLFFREWNGRLTGFWFQRE